MPKKKHKKDGVEQSKNQLFSDIDAKSAEISGYTLGHGAPQLNQTVHEHSIPTGVVEVDDSVVFPPILTDSQIQHDSESFTNIQSNQKQNKEHVYLPPITHQHYQHYPHQYHAQPNHHHSYRKHHSFHQHRPHHHQNYGKTYDPRWWYMPLNSVHGPKSQQPQHHHYVPPKWYEVQSRQ